MSFHHPQPGSNFLIGDVVQRHDQQTSTPTFEQIPQRTDSEDRARQEIQGGESRVPGVAGEHFTSSKSPGQEDQ